MLGIISGKEQNYNTHLQHIKTKIKIAGAQNVREIHLFHD